VGTLARSWGREGKGRCKGRTNAKGRERKVREKDGRGMKGREGKGMRNIPLRMKILARSLMRFNYKEKFCL